MTAEWKQFWLVAMLCAGTIISSAQTFTTMVEFSGPNGSGPSYEMSLTQGLDGNLYGTTYYGGTHNYGVVFKMTPQGTLTVLYSFDGAAAYPVSGVGLGTDGTFYGTTVQGGTDGYGAVYRITPNGAFTMLGGFNVSNGATPYGTPIQGADGNIYGTTVYGGPNNQDCLRGCGTIYKMTPAGVLTMWHAFTYTDGGTPWAGLIQATNGNFYGTTYGGTYHDHGSVFQITPAGTLTTVHSFESTDGYEPSGTLIQGLDGNLYGTTEGGGVNSGGTVFKINAKGKFMTLYSMDNNTGGDPIAGVIQATDGNLYGTSYSGDAYELSTTGSFLFSGRPPIQGEILGGLFQATNGIFYGTTSQGGPGGGGTIFRLDMGLGPFVSFVRGYGKVGQTGGILGQGFVGTTSVTLNGVPATFKVVSDTYITATVPFGATSGYVTVTTPSGTLTSNKPFIVLR